MTTMNGLTKTMMIEMFIEIAKKYTMDDRDGFETAMRAFDDCNDCKVSKKNEGGCDCQIIKCAECGEEGHKYNHNLCEDGSLRCDVCYEDDE